MDDFEELLLDWSYFGRDETEATNMMTTYENAPATKMLATHCIVCGRPLVDAVSVEMGIGPECRRKHGFDDSGVSPAAKTKANKIVHDMALHREDASRVGAGILQLAQLGFEKLAMRIADRLSDVRIELKDGRYFVQVPYVPALIDYFRTIPGRRFHCDDGKRWSFPVSSKPAVWYALQRFMRNHMGLGPRGPFVIN